MPSRDPAEEPLESRDLALGAALRTWASSCAGADVRGPFDSAGMDPTWLLRLTTAVLDTEVYLFYGPRAEFAAFRPDAADEGMYVAYASPITEAQLIEMVTELAAAANGAALPAWLHLA
jgi:hypothetical protein